MSKFFNTRLSALAPYVPGEQPKDMAYIKLNTNESPYPPSENVIAAVNQTETEHLRLYPDPTCSALKDALAKQYDVKRENVFVSNGSDDILNFAFLAFGEKGVVFPDISYGFYKVFAALHGLSFETVPLKEDFSINPEDYFHAKKLVVIANPNAPTGLLLSLSDIERIVQENKDAVVVIDEAYIDFGGESAACLTKQYENLLVVGTFSKSRSLAGARLGFAVGNRALIGDLETIKFSTNPYSINRLSLVAGVKAIESKAYYDANCEEIIKTREFTKEALKNMGFTVTDSYANFVFAKKEGVSGEEIYQYLRKNGVLVRHFNDEKIKDYNRITIGTKREMETLISVLQKMEKEA